MTEIQPISSACGGPSRSVLVRYDTGELGTADRASVARHLEACAGCRRELESFAAERAAVAVSVPWTRLEARAEAAVSRRRPWRSWAALFAPVAVFAAVAVWIHSGEDGPAAVRAKGGVALSFVVRVEDGAREGVDGEALRIGDAIRLRYSAGGAPYVLVVGVDADGRAFPYFDAAGSSRPADGAGGLLPSSVVLDADPRPERVFLLATQSPLAVNEVEAAARAALGRGSTIEALTRLPLEAEQASLLLRKKP